MGLLPDYSTITNSQQSDVSQINTPFQALYNLLGTTSNAPTFSDANIAVGAAINPAKISGTAATLSGNNSFTGTTTLALVKQTILNLTETVASLAATALDPTKLVHVITGTAAISTFTGGVEGQVAWIVPTGAFSLTGTSADTLNGIHLKSYVSGATDLATFAFTGATATKTQIKRFIYTASMPGFTVGQWFEI